MKYSEKLKDPRWQRKRLEVLNRDDFACMACGNKKMTLNVHHKQYHGDPWEASNDSLETLCENCHEERGKINKEFMSLATCDAFSLMRDEWAQCTVDLILAAAYRLKIRLSVNAHSGALRITRPRHSPLTETQLIEHIESAKDEVASELFRRGIAH